MCEVVPSAPRFKVRQWIVQNAALCVRGFNAFKENYGWVLGDKGSASLNPAMSVTFCAFTALFLGRFCNS